MEPPDDALDWTLRSFVYQHIVEHERPPTAAESAAALGSGVDEARGAYERLHRRHALFLDPDGRTIRMANPFAGGPTPFRVLASGHGYWANCAWDALGIPAALHADARIRTMCAESRQPITVTVKRGQVRWQGEVVHFLVPFRHWYDDLTYT